MSNEPALPLALRPWSSALAGLGEDLHTLLGPWLQRLDAMIGARFQLPHDRGDPDGYGDLSRRGSFERLLMSEWALAELYPEEFLRRASSGEQAFLSLAHKGARQGEKLRVVFDAGPSQLGAPRLAHVALLVVLERRARQCGQAFEWATLQWRPEQSRQAVDPDALYALLGAHTLSCPSAAQIERWAGSDAGVWLVGDRSLARHAAKATVVCVEESWRDPLLHVAVAVAGSPHGRIALALPAPELCARVLRMRAAIQRAGPRPGAQPVEAMPAQGKSFLLNHSGHHLISVDSKRRVGAWHVPGALHAPQGRTRWARDWPESHVIAFGWAKKHPLVVRQLSDRRLAVQGFGDSYVTGKPLDYMLPENDAISSAFAVGRAVIFRGNNGTLVRIARGRDPEYIAPGARPIGYWGSPDKADGAVCFSATKVSGRRIFLVGQGEPREVPMVGPNGDLGAWLCWADRAQHGMAVRTTVGQWSIFRHRDWPLGLDPVHLCDLHIADQVVGLTYLTEPMLVVLDPAGRSLSAVGRSSSVQLPQTKSPIVQARVSNDGRFVAYATFSGSLRVYSFRREGLVAHWRLQS